MTPHDIKILLQVAFNNAVGYRVGKVVTAGVGTVTIECSGGVEVTVPTSAILQEQIELKPA